MASTEDTPESQPASIWNIPFPRDESFTGRGKVLHDLRVSFVAKAARHKTQVVLGPGGIGKTQLAVEYAYKHRWDYAVVWWLDAEDPTALLLGYSRLAAELGLSFSADTSLDDIRFVLRDVLGKRDDWLLIFDNAATPEELRNFIPDPLSGHVLVTSRGAQWPGGAEVTHLDGLTRAEAVTYLRKRTGRNDLTEVANKLAQALGGLPLALEQAAAVVNESRLSLGEYLERFESLWAELLMRGRRSGGYPDSVAMSLELAVRELEEEFPGAADLLSFCAFLGPEPIGLPFLQASALQLPESLTQIMGEISLLDLAIEQLQRYALVKVGERGMTIHRVVAAIVRDRLAADRRRQFAEAAVQRMVGSFWFESSDAGTWRQCLELLPHALAAADHAEDLQVGLTDAAGLLDDTGRFLHHTAQFSRAREIFSRAMNIYEKVCGSSHPRVAMVANNLGRVLTRIGDIEQARECFDRALSIDQSIYGDDDPRVATVMNNYGLTLYSAGEKAAARRKFEQALRVYEKHYGPDHVRTASALNNLGYVIMDVGEVATAGEHFERALRIVESASAGNHPMVARVLVNLSEVHRWRGDLPTARAALERAMRLDVNIYGAEHTYVAQDLFRLGQVHEEMDDLRAALECYERSVAIDEAAQGPDHPAVVAARKAITGVLERLER